MSSGKNGVDEPVLNFELYRHPKQGRMSEGEAIAGFDLKVHLEEKGCIGRAFSLESPMVQGWIKNPETCPEEFKGQRIFLWGSIRGPDPLLRKVAYLSWFDGCVDVGWAWLGDNLYDNNPALLALEQIEALQGQASS